MFDPIAVPDHNHLQTFLNPTRRYLLDRLKIDVRMIRGVGARLFDAEGREYIDFLAQYGALPFGHNHPEILAVVQACFAQQMPAMVQPLIAVHAEELAARLAGITPGDLAYTILTTSGAEAVEAALKLARSRTGRARILATANAYHGQTLGALSATGRPAYHRRFGAPLLGFDHLPFGDLAALERKLAADGADTAAFIVEPVQGEGGIYPAPAGYLRAAQELCHRHGVLVIVDEIQTGLGRTGTLFAVEHERIVPDILIIAKALGGGVMPIGACIARPDAWDHHFGLAHSSTFANNNIAAAVALRVLDLLERDDRALIVGAAQSGAYLLDRLAALQRSYPGVIKELRGRGLMIGVEFYPFDSGDSWTMAYFSKSGLLTALISSYLLNVHRIITAAAFDCAHVLRIEPPLIISRAEIDAALEAIETLVAALARHDYYQIVRHLAGNCGRPDQPRDYRSPERRSAPVAPHPPEHSERFAFLVHPIYASDLVVADRSFEQFTPAEFQRWQAWSGGAGPGTVYHIPQVRSATGATAQGWLIALPMLPRALLRCDRATLASFFNQSIAIARSAGAGILGLGGFTAVVSRGGAQLAGCGLPITTGNTLTALLAVESIQHVAARRGLDLRAAQVAVVGATGAIGRLVALLLAPLVGGLVLLGNPRSANAPARCRALAEEIYQLLVHAGDEPDERAAGVLLGRARQVVRTAGLPDMLIVSQPGQALGVITLPAHGSAAIASCAIVVLATSSAVPIVEAGSLREGAIVCDIARPTNLAPGLAERRPDIFAFEGGMARLPEHIQFGPDLPYFRDGVVVGCLAETLLLALERRYADHSIGPRLSLHQATELKTAMQRHGFGVALP